MSSLAVLTTSILLFFVTLPRAEAGDGHRRPVRSLLEIREEGVAIQRWDIRCRAAARTTVLTYRFNDPCPKKRSRR